MPANNYLIEDTPMYPNRWKVVRVGSKPKNSHTEFFETQEEALKEIELRRTLDADAVLKARSVEETLTERPEGM